ncbi:phosphotransferase enzyme family protein [Aspergillus granulosus]|uniref:Phosphotransferase enzyme family protein n=1 Tax=Aspergillus granulosus TaxID=176169 RepID=A0ABR4I5U4_9EURO
MASLVSLPYYASDVPFPLPTDTEIDDAPDITLAYGGRRVVQVGHYVVKFGKCVNLLEGENLLFVREKTNIPVPQVYAIYTKPETGKNYIVMEQIHGETLQSLWPRLTSPEKDSIMTTMRVYFNELRNLPPPDYYGSLGGRSLLDEIFWTYKPEPAINGPFTSEDALNEAFALKYIYDGRPNFRADFYRQCLPRILHNHQPTFTHGDFQRKNIIIQRAEDEAGVEAPKGIRVVLLDWEKSGWYPSYWDYCLAVCALRWDDDWGLWIEKTLDPFVSVAAWLQTLRLELWS